MRWEVFVAERADRRERALTAAAALRRGDETRARALLGTWRFADHAGRVLTALATTPPRPTPTDRGALLAPTEPARPPVPPDTAAWILRREVAARATPTDADPLAWALAHLEITGAEVARRERAAWAAARHAPGPADTRVAAMWARWFAGDPWAVHEAWERLFLPEAMAAFTGVMRERHLPADVQDRARDDLAGALLPFLIGAQGQIPGWALLAVRVVETAGDGPVAAAAGTLGDAADRVGACVAHRGSRAATAATWWHDLPDPATRAHAGARYLREGGDAEAFLDLHVALRLVDAWADGRATTDEGTWHVVLQNRARARARLRAAVAELDRARLRDAVLALDALHARTAAAMRRLAAAWARDVLRYGMALDFHRGLTAPCVADALLPPLPASPALRAWVLLVALKDRSGHLERWVRTAGTGDRDPRWGRLLAAAPDALADPGDPGRRARTYQRLRLTLADQLLDRLEEWAPTLRAIAAGPADAVATAIDSCWPDLAVPPPVHKLGQLHRELVAGLPAFEATLARLRGDPAAEDDP